ncbi:unnamed protein product, partial [Brugia timori]|uniref:Protein aurora borealis n=1 Tax=Brugia timori TaxID=42155 RepID=A0A0R3QFS8_9BILA
LHNDNRITPASSSIASDSDSRWHHAKVRSAVAFYDDLVETGLMVSPTVFRSPRDSSLDQQMCYLSKFACSRQSFDCFEERADDINEIRPAFDCSMRSSLSSPLSSEIESLCSEQSFDCSEESAENTNEKTLIAEKNFESDVTFPTVSAEDRIENVIAELQTSKDVMVYSSNIAGNSKIRKS